jgi:1,4-dihydroxy-2-naphthoate octaprenyltransferase
MKAWLKAFRLRTLPLALSCIGMASMIAFYEQLFQWPIFIFAMLTTLFLQILSNLANDYGDYLKGADNEHRVGPERTLQSGAISVQAMRNMIIVFVLLSLLSGILLLYYAFKNEVDAWKPLLFLGLGIASIAAAIKYTAGKGAYGYLGLGDLFVFLFFGWVGVMGCYYLYALQFNAWLMLPATTIGCFAAGVLNINNIRDMKNDVQVGKITFASILGPFYARMYHVTLLLIGVLGSLVYMNHVQILAWYTPFAFVLVIWNAFRVWTIQDDKALDPYLKQMVLSTLVFCLIFFLHLVI